MKVPCVDPQSSREMRCLLVSFECRCRLRKGPGLTLGRDDMLRTACWRDMIGLSNHALSRSASRPLASFFEARPTETRFLVEVSTITLVKSSGVSRGVRVTTAR